MHAHNNCKQQWNQLLKLHGMRTRTKTPNAVRGTSHACIMKIHAAKHNHSSSSRVHAEQAWAVGSGQWAVGKWKSNEVNKVNGSGQWAVGSGQWAVGSGQSE